MPTLPFERLQEYRARTFRYAPGKRLKNRDEAVRFVNQQGFIYFWPIKDIDFPSLWTAVAGNRPVADAHNDPGHKTWGWKDALLGTQAWYYAKILRKRATIIAMEVVPYFYALSENYGSPEEDYLTLYQQGRLTQESKAVYEALLTEGMLDTIALRRVTRLTSRESDSRFNRALTDLQTGFMIAPVGVTDSGRWHYAFAYDLVTRRYPDILEQARFISDQQARRKLAELFFRSVGAAPLRQVTRLFGWTTLEAETAATQLAQAGVVCRQVEVSQQPGEWWALTDLVG